MHEKSKYTYEKMKTSNEMKKGRSENYDYKKKI